MHELGPVYPRLQIRAAKAAPRAVVCCEVSRRFHHIVSWSLDSDRLEHGSWFAGAMRLIDVSHDGRWFSYAALGGVAAHGGEAWTAIGIAPRVEAMAFWPTIPPRPVDAWWLDESRIAVSGFVETDRRRARFEPEFERHFRVIDSERAGRTLPGPPPGFAVRSTSDWRASHRPERQPDAWPAPASDVSVASDGRILAAFGPVIRVFEPETLHFDRAIRRFDLTAALERALGERAERRDR